MQAEWTKIATRSKKQAMDWSLVLASQEIESVIEAPGENGGWGLRISAADSERAFQALRQYCLENRDWPWRHPVPWTQTHFDWLCLTWAALLAAIHWEGDFHPNLYDRGVMSSVAVYGGEWWRVFTAIMLHADVAHLAENLSIGIVLFGLAMGQYGTGTGLLAAYLAGVGGNVASLCLSAKPFQGLGASGMVMGALGLLAAQSLNPTTRRNNPTARKLAGLGAAVLLFVLYGFSPGSDTVAHLGGFVAGVGLGVILVRLPQKICQSLAVNLASGIALLAIIATTWWLALKR